MAELSFKETVLNLLSATDYRIADKHDQLDSIEADEDLKPFVEWFKLNLSSDNCITDEDLEEFRKLEENGEALYGDELEEALQVYRDQPVDSLVPFTESVSDTLREEAACLKKQLKLKENLLSNLKSSASASSFDLHKLKNNYRHAKDEYTEVLKDLFVLNKTFYKKLMEVKEILDQIRKGLADLEQVCEVSKDEGIDTFSSDQLNCSTWSVSSAVFCQPLTVSSSTDYVTSTSSGKLFCQLPIHKYTKLEKHFLKLTTQIVENLSKIGSTNESDMEFDLELQNIRHRLALQKQSIIQTQAEIEGIKAARDKVQEVAHKLHNRTWKPLPQELKDELADFIENKSDLDESFRRNVDDTNEVCQKWAEMQTCKPICARLEEEIECSKYILTKLDEITDILKTKVKTDKILRELFEWDYGRVRDMIELYTTLHSTVSEKLKATKERIEIINQNYQEYQDYCSLPVEERSELLKSLSALVGSDKYSVAQTTDALSDNCHSQHHSFTQAANDQLNTVISIEHKMKEVYNNEVQSLTEPQIKFDSRLCANIQNTLEEMSAEITDTAATLQENAELGEEKDEIQELLKMFLKTQNKQLKK